MSTTTRGRIRSMNKPSTDNITQGLNMAVLAAACAQFEMKSYGGGKPLYELLQVFGEVIPLNTLHTALQSFDEVRAGLKEGDAAFSYSEQFSRFNLAVMTPGSSIAFVGLLHDENGSPKVDEPLQLCWVRAVKDFDLEGEVIIHKGQEFMKAFPLSYITKLEKAA